MLTPLYTISGVDSGGLTEEHWHFAYTVFHALDEIRGWSAYPVSLHVDKKQQRVSAFKIAPTHVHYADNDIHIRVQQSLGNGLSGTAYLVNVEQGQQRQQQQVVIKVSPVKNRDLIEPRYDRDSETWHLDTAVLEPLTMAVLQARWTDTSNYPAAKLLCSFLVDCGEQVTVMTYEPGEVLLDLLLEGAAESIACLRSTLEFVYRAHHDHSVDVMDRHGENVIWRGGAAVQLDLGIARIRSFSAQFPTIDLSSVDTDPFRSMRTMWARNRQNCLVLNRFDKYINNSALEAAMQARRHPMGWLFEDLVQRLELPEHMAEAYSVSKQIPATMTQVASICQEHERALAFENFKKTHILAPLDYGLRTILTYGKQCAAYLVQHHRDEALAVVQPYVDRPTLPLDTYLPMLVFAALAYYDKESSLTRLREWAAKRSNLVALLPVFFTRPAALKRCLQDIDNKYARVIQHHLAPVMGDLGTVYADEKHALDFFRLVYRALQEECTT